MRRSVPSLTRSQPTSPSLCEESQKHFKSGACVRAATRQQRKTTNRCCSPAIAQVGRRAYGCACVCASVRACVRGCVPPTRHLYQVVRQAKHMR